MQALKKKFETDAFISGFFGNALLAAGLAYIGDRLDVPIYLAAIFAFGSRLFQNFCHDSALFSQPYPGEI